MTVVIDLDARDEAIALVAKARGCSVDVLIWCPAFLKCGNYICQEIATLYYEILAKRPVVVMQPPTPVPPSATPEQLELLPKATSILVEAESLTEGARNKDYGHPLDDYNRTAALWSAILGREVTAQQAILCMVAVKISRECHVPKRDNRVDGAGYFKVLDMAINEAARRAAK